MIHRRIACFWTVCMIFGALGCGILVDRSGNGPTLKVGQAITVADPVSIAHLSENPEAFVGQTIKIDGVVSAVCQGSGCWVEVRARDGSTFLAKSADHSILLPIDCVGRKIVVQGVVTAMPAQEQPEQSEPQEGEEPHECPRPSYLLETRGVELH